MSSVLFTLSSIFLFNAEDQTILLFFISCFTSIQPGLTASVCFRSGVFPCQALAYLCSSIFFSFLLLQEKCAQYWPTSEEREMAFRDTRFLVTLLSEDTKSYYTIRVLELQNINVGQRINEYKGTFQ